MASPVVFLVDSDPFQLRYMGAVLRAAGHLVEAFSRAEALLARVSRRERGCAVLELRMPGMNGLTLQRTLREYGVLLPLIFVSGSADVPTAVSAMKEGAVDFLCKPIVPEALYVAVSRAIQRDAEDAAEHAASEHAHARWAALSRREREVCHLLAKGLIIKQVAATLGLTQSTVQAHRARALPKLQVSTVAELVHLVARAGEKL